MTGLTIHFLIENIMIVFDVFIFLSIPANYGELLNRLSVEKYKFHHQFPLSPWILEITKSQVNSGARNSHFTTN